MTEAALALEELIRGNPHLWRGQKNAYSADSSDQFTDTGFTGLNGLLPNGGWPRKSMTEIVVPDWGHGELQILLPLLRHVQSLEKQIAFIAPPFIPYAPALEQSGLNLDRLIVIDSGLPAKDIWWVAEKIQRHPDCGVVLLWPDQNSGSGFASADRQLRKLQVAADAANNFGFTFRRGSFSDTPVGLRLKVARCEQGLSVEILKSRFGWSSQRQTVLPLA